MAEADVWGVPDVTQLTVLTESTVIDNIRVRFEHDEIHTFTGNILLVVNPYKRLNIYDREHMASFEGVKINRAQPHVYAIAEEAYNRLRRDHVSQAIVVSGESGAGKTETNKYLMRYLMWRVHSSAGEAAGAHLSDAILQSNPILEAFGNAKTGRNHNSSRFGKFVKLHVDEYGVVQGAVISTYLLEKTRVALHGPGERSFHIFYQLLAGASADERAALELRDGSAHGYHYLRQGGVPAVPGLDDGVEFGALRTAMRYVAIEPAEERQVLELVAAFLHLGCVEFEQRADDSAAPRAPAALAVVNRLLGVGDVTPLLVERRMRVAGTDFTLKLTAEQALGARDAFVRAFYELLFRWLTQAINLALVELTESCDFDAPSVGLLDVYGFEVFAHNSFEQLCINFANEKLHQFFLGAVFKMEAKLYEEECVPAAHIAYADNQPCLDLIEKSPAGIFRLLDSQCITPQASDGQFARHVNETHRASPFLIPVRESAGARASVDEVFVVRHFAGAVVYTTAGFLQKNNDALDPFFRTAMEASTAPLVAELLALDAGGAGGGGGKKRGGRGGGGGAFASVSKRFLAEISELLAQLGSAGSHFVRCIKPNSQFTPGAVDADALLRQLHANGTLEAVRLMRNGFPIRVPFTLLHSRYLPLLRDDVPAVRALTPSQFCELIATVVGVAPTDFVCGTTRIFLRGDAGALFDELRDKEPAAILPILKAKMADWEAKAAAREQLRPRLIGWVRRSRFLRMRGAAVRMQARYRGGRDRELATELLQAAADARQRAREAARRAASDAAASGTATAVAVGRGAGLTLTLPAGPAGGGKPPRAPRASDVTDPGDGDGRGVGGGSDRRSEDETVCTHFTERSELESMLTSGHHPSMGQAGEPLARAHRASRLAQLLDDDDDDDGGGGGGGGLELRPRADSLGALGAVGNASAPPRVLVPSLALSLQAAVQAEMRTKSYGQMEQEMTALIHKMRADAALQETQLLAAIKAHPRTSDGGGGGAMASRRQSGAIGAGLAAALTGRRQSVAIPAPLGGRRPSAFYTAGLAASKLFGGLGKARGSGAGVNTRSSLASNFTDDAEPTKRALLRLARSGKGAYELVIVEDGRSMPLFKKLMTDEMIERARLIFARRDRDRDGSVSLGEFLLVMQEMAARANRPPVLVRKLEAMFQIADIDEDGAIDFEEFVVMQVRRLAREQSGGKPDTIPLGARRKSSLTGMPRRLSRRLSRGRAAEAARADADADAEPSPPFLERLLAYHDATIRVELHARDAGVKGAADAPAARGDARVVDEAMLRALLRTAHTALRHSALPEGRARALVRMADPKQTGRMDLLAFGRIEAVHRYFTPNAPLPIDRASDRTAATPTERAANAPAAEPTRRGSAQTPHGKLKPRATPVPPDEARGAAPPVAPPHAPPVAPPTTLRARAASLAPPFRPHEPAAAPAEPSAATACSPAQRLPLPGAGLQPEFNVATRAGQLAAQASRGPTPPHSAAATERGSPPPPSSPPPSGLFSRPPVPTPRVAPTPKAAGPATATSLLRRLAGGGGGADADSGDKLRARAPSRAGIRRSQSDGDAMATPVVDAAAVPCADERAASAKDAGTNRGLLGGLRARSASAGRPGLLSRASSSIVALGSGRATPRAAPPTAPSGVMPLASERADEARVLVPVLQLAVARR